MLLSIFLLLASFLISACEQQPKGYNVNEDEYYLKVGDNINFTNKIVTLLNVGSGGNILIGVGSVQDVISAYGSKEINGLQIYNLDAFYSDQISNRAARIKVELAKTYPVYPAEFSGIHAGDIIKVNSVDLTLVNVGSGGNIVLNVNGVEDVIDKGSVKNINCLTIWNLGYSYADQLEERKVLLNVFYNDTIC